MLFLRCGNYFNSFYPHYSNCYNCSTIFYFASPHSLIFFCIYLYILDLDRCPIIKLFRTNFPSPPSLTTELSGGCIIDRRLYLWHLLLRSVPLPLSFSLSPPSLPRSVCAWPDSAWQVLRPTSIFHTNTTHTRTQNRAYTHTAAFPKCLCMGR